MAKKMPGAKAKSKAMLRGGKRSMAHDVPQGFEFAPGKAAGKEASAPVARKRGPMTAATPRKMRSPGKKAKAPKIKIKKPG